MATDLAKLTGAQQIEVLKNLSQQAASFLLGVSARTLRDHPGDVARNADGTYDGRGLLKSGAQSAALPEVTGDEIEKLLQIAEWLGMSATLDSDGSLLTAISLGKSLAERYGNAGLALFGSILLESWRDITSSWGREPTETELRDRLENEFRDRLDREQQNRLRRQFKVTFVCERCKRIRLGRSWSKSRVPLGHIATETICPACEKKPGPKNLGAAIEEFALQQAGLTADAAT